MKIVSIVFFCVFVSFLTNAQIIINRSDFAVTTSRIDSGQWKLLTKTGANVPTFGNNQVWDYSFLKDSQTSVYANYFVPAPNWGPVPSAFTDATTAYNFRTIFNSIANYPSRSFQKIDSSGYTQLGITTSGGKFSLKPLTGGENDSLIFLPDTIRYPSKVFIYKFPLAIKASWKNQYIEPINYTITVLPLGLNNTHGQRIAIYNAIDTVVGWGTLRLKNPSGGVPLDYAVLLHRHNESRIDSFFLDGSPTSTTLLNVVALEQGKVTTSLSIYKFLGIGFKEPLMYLSANANGGISTTYRAVLPNLGLTVAAKDLKDPFIKTVVYPNPATNKITFEFEKSNLKNWNILIYNKIGQLMSINEIVASQGLTQYSIEINKNLPNGIYLYNIIDETSLIRSKGKFQVYGK